MELISLADVFTEWKRRFDLDPDEFQTCEAFAGSPPLEYGEAAAAYFTWLRDEMRKSV